MTEKEKMLSGLLYTASEEEIQKDYINCREQIEKFNRSSYNESKKRNEIIKKLFKKTGKNFTIMPPIYCDYGKNISIGENFYANYDCIFLDVNEINIGDNCFLAPRVSIFTAGHPIDKDIRNEYLEYGYSVKIGNDVWIGGNTTINPGVSIGNNVVIGSGSVVTKDIPSNVVACGNPCKVIRNITENDRLYWEKEKQKAKNL